MSTLAARARALRIPSTADIQRALASVELRPLLIWLVILAAGVTLLYGRYDWDAGGGRFADRGFFLSAYVFLIALPTLFYLARWLLRSTTAALVITGLAFLITTFPYEWTGLDQLYYYLDRAPTFMIDQERFHGDPSDPTPLVPSLEFFPGGTLRAFPYDYLFWPLLVTVGTGAIWGVWWLRNRAQPASRRVPVLLTVAFAAICAQAFVHTGMRAPYTYLAHFQLPREDHHWYHVYHWPDGSGASESDQHAFTTIEDYFQGAERDGLNMLLRRPVASYVASQGSYFFNTFYVWLGLNCLFWLVAVFATARLVGRLTNERAGLIAGALTAVSPGFIAYVATPAMYMAYYAAVAIALCLFEDLVVRNRARDWGAVALFTGCLALCALVYDMSPLFLVLLAYGLARKVAPGPLIASLAVAFVATAGFGWVATHIAGIDISTANTAQIEQAWHGFKGEVLNPTVAAWYDHVVTVIPSFSKMFLQAFFVLPVFVAFFGIEKIRGNRPVQVLVYGLIAMVFATVAFFQIGKEATLLTHLPRLIFPAFVTVYLLAAVALDPGPRPQNGVRDRDYRARIVLASIVVGGLFVLGNMDIFGHPTLYVEFFVSDRPAFTP